MRLVVLVIGLAVGASAVAGPCGPPKEYAQYKDDAKEAFGRSLLAQDYCLLNDLQAQQQLARDRDECRAEKTKMMDAVKAARDTKTTSYMLAGCPVTK